MPHQSNPKNPPAGLKLKQACRKVAKQNLKKEHNLETPLSSKDFCEHVGTKSVLAPQIGWHGENAGRYFKICKACHVKKFLTGIPDEAQQDRIDKARLGEAIAREEEKKSRAKKMKVINEQVKELRQNLKLKAGLASKPKNKPAAVPRTPSSPFLTSSSSGLREFTPPTPDALVKHVLGNQSTRKRKRAIDVIDLTVDESDGERPAKKQRGGAKTLGKHSLIENDSEIIIIE
ncbi:hypothetical protein M422DRAFT_44708 [Sphaerobolus stellatus SS14]|uniref:Uncharacterized protein n=1 Tax=Sphaerobolus stellatus (strain SS14) TaxID=990650 RepID=A0A0C9U3M5_SPHS4|nr:hypothetical protein M422DRAFT_56725 [Sphaerobolus stellatus SS14]KIJ49322.1 hypothetical protein M422DRAFT_44708 [Sphaerobolus stellatus SS14]